MPKRRRVKQTISMHERLATFSKDVREQAQSLPPGSGKDDPIRRARQAETAANPADWASSLGLRPPK